MSTGTTNAREQERRPLRSAGAVLAGLAAVMVLSVGTDQIFHSLGVYPPWGEPMQGTGQHLLAFAYRCVYSVAGSYVAAHLAPGRPMAHAMALGVVGLVLATAGAIAMWDFGQNWFPVALVLSALPCAWAGGTLYVKTRT